MIETLAEAGIEGGRSEASSRIWDGWMMKFSGRPGRAVAAYKLSERWFGGVVPETVGVEWGGALGSAQRIVGGTTAHRTENLHDAVRTRDGITDMANMVALDWMLGNPDRHGDNWMVSGGRIAAIDNEAHFKDPDYRVVLAPVYRTLLHDDNDWTPMLLNAMWDTTDALIGRGRSLAAVYRAWTGESTTAASWDARARSLKRLIVSWGWESAARW